MTSVNHLARYIVFKTFENSVMTSVNHLARYIVFETFENSIDQTINFSKLYSSPQMLHENHVGIRRKKKKILKTGGWV